MEILYKKMWEIDKLEARKMLVETYQKTGSIKKTAYLWHTSRDVVRKWIKRWREQGEGGLLDLSKKPKSSPNKVAKEIEEKVIKIREKRGYGIRLSESTALKILRRNNLTKGKKKKRKVFYPAVWAY